jgi:hypothetical protein
VAMQRERAERGEHAIDVVRGPKGWGAFGAFDAAERKQALDDLGFARQLVFSTFSGGQYLRHPDLTVRYGGIRAHNRAMAEFCKHDSRLIAVGQLALDNPECALVEFHEGVRLGCGTFWIPAMPAGDKSPGHPDLNPLWQAFCDANIPFMLHVGPNSRTKHDAYENNGRPRPKDVTGAEGGENLRVRDFMVLAIAPHQFLTSLVFDGIFERWRDRVGRGLGAGISAYAGLEPEDIQAHRSQRDGATDEGVGLYPPGREVYSVSRRRCRSLDPRRRCRTVSVLERLSTSGRHRRSYRTIRTHL